MKGYKKLMDVVAEIEKIVISAVLVVVTAITFVNVVIRKLSETSLPVTQFAWTEELVINLFVLLIMLGCALAAREGSLISLSLVYDRLKTGGKKAFIVIITFASLFFWILLIKTGFEKVANQMATGKQTPSLDWPEWVFTIFLPIGAIFLVLHTVEFFVDNVFGGGLKEGKEAADND